MIVLSLKVGIVFHYCGGHLAQAKVFVGTGKASCGMEDNKIKCQNKNFGNNFSIPCCQDQINQINTDNFQTDSKIEQIFDCLNPLIHTFSFLNITKETNIKNFFGYYSPPDLTTVSLSFIRVFLI